MLDKSLNANVQIETQPIAIIGIACRYPGGANCPATFWKLLQDEVDAITEVPADRFDIDYYYDPSRRPGKIVTRAGGFLSEIDRFDPAFFGISPREAAFMDPQHRLLLETAWEALENAGQAPERLAGSRTGVFVAIWSSEYEAKMYGASDDINFHILIGGARYPAAGRISYEFDFQGPSLIIDTACSSSLVAVHLACQSLWAGESTLALAGGVNLMLEPGPTIGGSRAGMLSVDGRCKFGDASANGYVRSEGVGMVVLKPLPQALADKDPIYALILGSATNNDGRSGGVLSAPGYEAQVTVMREAYRKAKVPPGQVDYVEAHGTGTPTGDPIEVRALATVLGEGRPPNTPCIIGSVKTNIGHTEPASGVAGLIKAALCLKHRAVPASLHFKDPNPNIPWSELPLVMQRSWGQWPERPGPVFAGVNSFGITGTNAHVVLQSPPPSVPPEEADTAHKPQLVQLSAHTPEALKDLAQRYLQFARQEAEGFSLRDFGYTTTLRRAHHAYRLALVVRDREELIEHLEAFLQDQLRPGMSFGHKDSEPDPRIVFICSGMGPQWWGMGRELLAQEPVFRAAIQECDALFQPLAGWSLLDEFTAPEAESRMGRTDVAQPANFALQVGLAALWRSWGLVPAALVGHSAGEIAAACLAGILSLPDAVKVIYHRSRLQQLTAGEGKMVAVGLSQSKCEPFLAGYTERISMAAVNSPTSVTLSGEAEALAEVVANLEAQEIFARFLHTDVPFHSPQMDRLRTELLEVLQDIECHPPVIPIYTTVTGQLADSAAYGAAYWWQNVRQPVRFAQAIAQIIADGYCHFLELAPHPVLARSVSECLQFADREGLVLPSLRRGEAERAQMLGSMGEMHARGIKLEWEKLYPAGQCITLPLYPWQRESLWFEEIRQDKGPHRKMLRRGGRPPHPFLEQYLQSACPEAHLWQLDLDLSQFPYLRDHRAGDSAVFPAAAYLEMVLAASSQIYGPGPHAVENVSFQEALFLSENLPQVGQLVISPNESGKASFQFFSRRTDAAGQKSGWTLHAQGALRIAPANLTPPQHATPDQIKTRCQASLSGAEHYQRARQRRLNYGPSFQGVQHVWQLPDEVLGQLRLADSAQSEAGDYHLHPALLDSAIQVFLDLLQLGDPSDTYLPVGLERLCLYAVPRTEEIWGHAQLRPGTTTDADLVTGDLHLLDPAGQVLAEIQGARFQRLKYNTQDLISDWLYDIQWQSQALTLPGGRGQGTKGAAPVQPGAWLIFTDGGGIGTRLQSTLAERGETCVIISPGETFKSTQPGYYTLNPSDAPAFRRLLQDRLKSDQPPVRGVIHLWSLESALPKTTLSSLAAAQDLGCVSLLHLVQALIETEWREAPSLWLVTSGVQPVALDGQLPSIAQSALWGLGKVIAQEHPEFRCKMADLSPTPNQEEVTALLQELWCNDSEDYVALRRGARYVARLAHCSMQAASTLGEEPPIRPDATYLITGGLGGLGLTVAQWMVKQGARHLVLLGRSAVSLEKKNVLEKMKNAGAEVVVAEADVSNEQDVARVMATIKQTLPPLRGVVHAAGVLADATLRQLDREGFLKVTAPKIAGAWNLHTQTLDQPLDFFVLFSSVASLVGLPGQGNYAAANAFLDTLAHYRHSQGLPALSINWGAWSGVGMAAAQANRGDRLAAQGLTSLTPRQGIEAFKAALGYRQPQIGIMSLDLQQWLQSNPRLARWSLLAELAKPFAGVPGQIDQQLSAAAIRENLLTASPKEQLSLLEAYLREQLARILKLAPARVGLNAPLQTLGVDSLFSLELRNRLETDLGITLSATAVWNHPTVKALALHVAGKLGITTQTAAEPPSPQDTSHEKSLETDQDIIKILEKAGELSDDELRHLMDPS